MIARWSENFLDMMHKGGPIMWVLLGMSIVALTMIFERAWFWFRNNNNAQLARAKRMEMLLRKGDWASAKVLAEADTSVYGRIVATLARDGCAESVVTSLIETERNRLDRFMGILSTMITAAPLVGLLGTVIGLILTFEELTAQQAGPQGVGVGLAQALFNTAGGLAVAIITVFPYNIFRVQTDRTLGRIESILAAAGAVPKTDSAKPGHG